MWGREENVLFGRGGMGMGHVGGVYIESRNLSGFRDLSVTNCPAETTMKSAPKIKTFYQLLGSIIYTVAN
jgi:hypothetical protein